MHEQQKEKNPTIFFPRTKTVRINTEMRCFISSNTLVNPYPANVDNRVSS
jgi:hypothetical protein